MDVSVIICTFNRAEHLSIAVQSVVAQVMPQATHWEVLVVDNNSSDRTSDVVKELSGKFPNRIRYIFEPQQGLSRARNAGIRASSGQIVAFTDDDIIANPLWLANLTAPLLHGEWSGSGGRILLPSEFQRPEWMNAGGKHDLFGTLLPLFDLGNLPVDMPRPPYGANMAFRRSMFEKYGDFRIDLGRCGSNYLMGEELDFGNRLIQGGEILRYEPEAIVFHPVQEERLSKTFYRRWWFDFGRTRVIEKSRRKPILGFPRELVSILNQALRYLPIYVFRWLISPEAASRFYYECQIRSTCGEIVENYRCMDGLSIARMRTGKASERRVS